MNKKRILWLSLIIGILVEGSIWGFGAMFAKFGPCGPGNEAAGVLLLLHLPSFWVAKHLLPQNSSLDFLIALILAAIMWSMVVYFIIRLAKSLYGREKKAAT